MKIKNILVSALVILGFTSFSGIANASCGKLVIAEQNWASAELMANVDKIILEKVMVVRLSLYLVQLCQLLLQWMKKVSQT